MPNAYSLDPLHRLVRGRIWGDLRNDDLAGFYLRLAADARFVPNYRELLDLRGVLRFLLDSSFIADVAAWPVFKAGSRRAFIAASEVAYGLSRMFAIHADAIGQDVQVFRSERLAEEWLESPENVAPELPPAQAA